MSKVLQRRTALLALFTSLVFCTAALAQMPINPWKKAAPFPYPDEELYGVALNGKMHVIGGWDEGKAAGLNYQYDPATDKWTEQKGMPRLAHHAALAAANGKIYVIGGATTVAGSKDPYFTFFGPSLVLTTNEVFDPATNKWESRRPMSVARNHAYAAAVNGKIYVIGGRTGHAFILSATNTDVVEEYSPVSDMWSAPKERMPTPRSGGACDTDGRRIYIAGGEVTTKELVGAFRAVE